MGLLPLISERKSGVGYYIDYRGKKPWRDSNRCAHSLCSINKNIWRKHTGGTGLQLIRKFAETNLVLEGLEFQKMPSLATSASAQMYESDQSTLRYSLRLRNWAITSQGELASFTDPRLNKAQEQSQRLPRQYRHYSDWEHREIKKKRNSPKNQRHPDNDFQLPNHHLRADRAIYS